MRRPPNHLRVHAASAFAQRHPPYLDAVTYQTLLPTSGSWQTWTQVRTETKGYFSKAHGRQRG
jgi:hypothetical protein